ncbi:MAG: hypothetical protein ABR595_05345 [Psychroflexus sp.]
MKKLFLSVTILASLFLVSCSSDDDSSGDGNGDGNGNGDENSETRSGILTEDETWTSDKFWILDGKVVVDEGVTLTIEPGTIIKGGEGQEAAASALVVDQGGKLIANGTADAPIIFTSVLDNIELGEIAGTNLGLGNVGLWGGVLVLGNAPISVDGNIGTAQVEGIPATESYGQYGGDNPQDDSGVLRYVSIRHGGITIGQDNEINGLTLGGVGTGTTIDFVEVVANQDDAFEWFGGTTNSSNLLAWAQQDDGLDIDQAYNGTITNAAVIQSSNSDRALEIDGPEGSDAANPADFGFTIDGLTVIDAEEGEFYADFRDGAIGTIRNAFFSGSNGEAKFRMSEIDSQNNFENGLIVFDNNEIVLPSNVTDLEDLLIDAPAGSEANFTGGFNVIDSASDVSNGVGADLSVFAGWTYASSQDAL